MKAVFTEDPAFRCVLCGSERARQIGRVARCRRCGLLSTWPPPSDETLTAVYESGDYLGARSMDSPDGAVARAQMILSWLPDGPVLDYGAGAGHLVAAARQLGREAVGVEPSATARQTAPVDLLDKLPREGSFKAILLVHVLEHIREPVADLAALRALMAPGAGIYIEVPHAGSVHMLWERDRLLDWPVHLHHFTPRTLKRTVDKAGLAVDAVRLVNSAPVEWMVSRRATRLPGRVLTRAKRVLPGWKFSVIARRTPTYDTQPPR
jgi:SAM-dependent methyltransferase